MVVFLTDSSVTTTGPQGRATHSAGLFAPKMSDSWRGELISLFFFDGMLDFTSAIPSSKGFGRMRRAANPRINKEMIRPTDGVVDRFSFLVSLTIGI